MKKFVAIAVILLCAGTLVRGETLTVYAGVYDSSNTYLGQCKMEFIHNGHIYTIDAMTDPFGQLAQFTPQNNGCVSTSEGTYGTTYWMTGAYKVGSTVKFYWIAIFERQNGGGYNIYFKECPPDKSSMPESRYVYRVSATDEDLIRRNFIIQSTLDLRVMAQGNIFGDGVFRKEWAQGNLFYGSGSTGHSSSTTMTLEELRHKAESGDADAQFNLGYCYDAGEVVAQNYAEAAKWYRKAADQGHAEAQFNLAAMYYDGTGVTQSYIEAVKWYRKSADQGFANAQCNLGLCYEKGNGVQQSYTEALRWYRKAADQGIPTAQNNLGLMYSEGKGVTQDYTEALNWWRKAAEQGHPGGQYNLGVQYANGEGVEQSYTEAAKWYRKAADQGYASAQYNLGLLYYFGQGVTQDYTQAANLFRKAADQGFSLAQYNLGVCYEYGLGVTKNSSEAMSWYRKAAAQGYSDAENALKRLGQ